MEKYCSDLVSWTNVLDAWSNGWMDTGQMNGQMDGRINGWMDRRTAR